MNIFLNNKKKYSFSPDEILKNSYLNAYELIDFKKFNKNLNLFYICLSKLDERLKKKKIKIGLRKSIIAEILINSGIFYFLNFFSNKKIYGKIKKIEMVETNTYLEKFIKKKIKVNLIKHKIFKKNNYSKIQILKQLNFKEIKYFLLKKIFKIDQSKVFNKIIYKECPLLINEAQKDLKKTFFIRENLYFKKKIKKKKLFNFEKDIMIVFGLFFNSFKYKKLAKEIITDITNETINKYYYNYKFLDKHLDNFNILENSNFLTSQLSNVNDFTFIDLLKKKYKSKIIAFQHGHGQGLTKYHEKIKFFKESSYSDFNYVFSNNAYKYDSKNNYFSEGKTIALKYHKPYNKIFTKLNYFNKKFDLVYFSPWHMNGTDHSIYNYLINDLEKINIEKDLVENYLSKANYNILIKKYPYNLQKYRSENFISGLTKRYDNLKYFDQNLKYPEFYQKNQIILMFGCGSTFGYLASFNNPVILINLKNYFPIKEELKNKIKKSIFLIDYWSPNFSNSLKKLIYNKNFLLKEWKNKSFYRNKFYKEYLGI